MEDGRRNPLTRRGLLAAAAALGGEARVSDNWKVRAGVGLSASGNTVGVGASFQW